jgi:hypothetical protein
LWKRQKKDSKKYIMDIIIIYVGEVVIHGTGGGMKIKKTILILLFANLYIHSENINSADADFCFDFRTRQPMLLLVKKNNDLEIRADERYIECKSRYRLIVDTRIDFVIESGRNVISFGGGYIKGWILGHSSHSVTTDRFRIRQPAVIVVEFPPYVPYSSIKRLQDDELVDLLLFENKIIDGQMMVSPICDPDLDTTYNFNFRARITGLCEPDFLNGFGREVE